MAIEIGPMEPAHERMRLVQVFEEAGFKVGKQARREEARFTRVFTCYRRINDFDDEEELTGALAALWGKVTPAMEKAGKVITKVAGG